MARKVVLVSDLNRRCWDIDGCPRQGRVGKVADAEGPGLLGRPRSATETE
jgi:hypothetical protein